MSLDLLTSSTPSFLNRGADTYARLIIFSAFGLEGLCKITVSPESTAFTLPSIGRGAIMEAKWTSAKFIQRPGEGPKAVSQMAKLS